MNPLPEAVIASIEGRITLADTVALRLHGDDCTDFLHGQFSCDVKGLATMQACPGAWCSPKGRVLFMFVLLKLDHNDYRLFLGGQRTEAFCKRLQMYILRSQVQIEPLSNHQLLGYVGAGAVSALQTEQIPQQPFSATLDNDRLLLRMPSPIPRLLMLTSDVPEHPALPGVTTEEWRALDMISGLPVLRDELADEYLPQMLNLDLCAGLSFTKGCYPGQEIVIRVRHRGRLKQRMVLLSSPVQIENPTTVYSEAGDKLGEIINTALLADGSMLFQAVIQVDSLQPDTCCFRCDGGMDLNLCELPYQQRLNEGSGL